jgi:hypothetical protein
VLGDGQPGLLVFEAARLGFEGFQVIVHGFVDDFTQRGGVFFPGLPNLKLWPRAWAAHCTAS